MKPTLVLSKYIMALVVFSQLLLLAGSLGIGVNYGLKGDNLPPPKDVINLIKSKGIQRVRIYEPSIEVLEALRGSTSTIAAVALGVRNEDLSELANNPEATTTWIKQYIIPYYSDVVILWLVVGNEVIPGENAVYVVPAMRNFRKSLKEYGLKFLEVTTAVSSSVIASSYPPSAAFFNDQNMIDVLNFINSDQRVLMVNLYPYFALVSDPDNIALDFALFTKKDATFTDRGLAYYNLFDAMYDAFINAIEKVVGGTHIQLIVAESGWPSAGGGRFASIENAKTYNNNLKDHCLVGTPRIPNITIDVFIFALFNENLKEPGIEQNFGSYYPNMEPVYPLW